jgi:hypothetical protein
VISKKLELIVTGDIDGRVYFYRWPTLELITSFPAHQFRSINGLRFDEDRDVLYSCAGSGMDGHVFQDGEFAIWRVPAKP